MKSIGFQAMSLDEFNVSQDRIHGNRSWIKSQGTERSCAFWLRVGSGTRQRACLGQLAWLTWQRRIRKTGRFSAVLSSAAELQRRSGFGAGHVSRECNVWQRDNATQPGHAAQSAQSHRPRCSDREFALRRDYGRVWHAGPYLALAVFDTRALGLQV